MEEAIELFSIFGGLGWSIDIDSDIKELMIENILDNYGHLSNEIDNYISADKSYHRLLHALAISDRRLPSAFKRAHLNHTSGGLAIRYLQENDILRMLAENGYSEDDIDLVRDSFKTRDVFYKRDIGQLKRRVMTKKNKGGVYQEDLKNLVSLSKKINKHSEADAIEMPKKAESVLFYVKENE